MPLRARFRYQTLLRVRELQEDVKALALSAVHRDIRIAEQQRAELVQRQLWTLDEAGRRARESFSPAEIHRYYQHERHLAREIVEKDALLVQLRRREADRRAELEDAMKRKRIIERLKAHHQIAQTSALNKAEQSASDEVATNAAALKRARR